MRTLLRVSMIAAFLAALVLATGCEDSPLTAGTDYTMELWATDTTVVVDPSQDPPTATTTLSARVSNASGSPQKGLTVFFSGGTFASGGSGVKTDGNGVASDVLTVGVDDADEITVTASSGSLAKTLTITKTVAGADFAMTLVATPSTVLVDPAHGVNAADASIVATILDDSGVPRSGLTVLFSTNGGLLASGGQGRPTNANGIASDTLTVRTADATETTVTATWGTLTKTVKVTKNTVAANRAPVAAIVASPAGEQAAGRAVVFDGSTSADPDTGDFIANYRWVVTSNNPDDPAQNPIVLEGAAVSSVTFPSFANVQTLTAVLTVTDHFGLTGVSAPMTYAIKARLCSDNARPIAHIAGGATLVGGVGTTQTFFADGTASDDLENGIQTYTWSCGNGTTPVVVPAGGSGATVECSYVVGSASQTYTVTLTVTDQGFGLPALECQQVSTAQTVQVVVRP